MTEVYASFSINKFTISKLGICYLVTLLFSFVSALVLTSNIPVSVMFAPIVSVALFVVLSVITVATLRHAGASRTCSVVDLYHVSEPSDDIHIVVFSLIVRNGADIDDAVSAVQYHRNAFSKNLQCIIAVDYDDCHQAHSLSDLVFSANLLSAVDATVDEQCRDYVHVVFREREFDPYSGLWMGRERKRGKIEDLAIGLLGAGETRFALNPISHLVGHVSTIVVLDIDARLTPECVPKLIGALNSHPSRPAIAVPRIEVPISARSTIFARAVFGFSPHNAEPLSSTTLREGLAGDDLFVGKGAINLRRFIDRTIGKMPTGIVLSHDHVEGMMAGVVRVSDAIVLESVPRDFFAWMNRQERWVRGDVQNALIFGAGSGVSGPRGALLLHDRIELTFNVLGHLCIPASTALVAVGICEGSVSLGTIGLLGFLPGVGNLAQAIVWPVGNQPGRPLALIGLVQAVFYALFLLSNAVLLTIVYISAVIRGTWAVYGDRRDGLRWSANYSWRFAIVLNSLIAIGAFMAGMTIVDTMMLAILGAVWLIAPAATVTFGSRRVADRSVTIEIER